MNFSHALRVRLQAIASLAETTAEALAGVDALGLDDGTQAVLLASLDVLERRLAKPAGEVAAGV